MTTSFYFKPSYKLTELKPNYLHLDWIVCVLTVLFRQSRLVCIFGGNGGRLYTGYVTVTSQALSPLPPFVFFPDFSPTTSKTKGRKSLGTRLRYTFVSPHLKPLVIYLGHAHDLAAVFECFGVDHVLLCIWRSEGFLSIVIALFLTKVDLCHGAPRYFPVVIFWSCENVVFVFNRGGWNGPWWWGKL